MKIILHCVVADKKSFQLHVSDDPLWLCPGHLVCAFSQKHGEAGKALGKWPW